MNTAAKGVQGEREVAAIFQTAGFDVRGLENTGDWLVVSAHGQTTHIEVKRHERLRVPEWIAQTEKDCPRGLRWVLAFRQSRRRWYAVVPLDEYAELLARVKS